jgi:hypothetical protein
MKSIYIASGWNSWVNKTIVRAFSTYTDALAFIGGLTDGEVKKVRYQSSVDLANILLKA